MSLGVKESPSATSSVVLRISLPSRFKICWGLARSLRVSLLLKIWCNERWLIPLNFHFRKSCTRTTWYDGSSWYAAADAWRTTGIWHESVSGGEIPAACAAVRHESERSVRRVATRPMARYSRKAPTAFDGGCFVHRRGAPRMRVPQHWG